jgi:hypothetical protein
LIGSFPDYFVELSHYWANWPPNIVRKASKEVRTILKRRGFCANGKILNSITKANYGWVVFYVRSKAPWWQLLGEFTQAL